MGSYRFVAENPKGLLHKNIEVCCIVLFIKTPLEYRLWLLIHWANQLYNQLLSI